MLSAGVADFGSVTAIEVGDVVWAAAYGTAKMQLARDLHDRAGWQLTALNYEILAAENDPSDRGKIAALRGRLDALSGVLRELTEDLRQAGPPPADLVDTVGCLLREWTRVTRIPTDIYVSPNRVSVGSNSAAAALAVLAELLTNVARHAADATCVRVAIRRLDRFGLSIALRDDGSGIDAAAVVQSTRKRFGIQGARERLRCVGGTLRIDRGASGGTLATVRIPDARQ